MAIPKENRLSESKRYLTKLLILASLLRYDLPPDILDIGPINQSEWEEAEDLAKHGSIHIPELLENIRGLTGFGKYVIGWSHLSVETSILEVVKMDRRGSIVVGLPNNREITCVELESDLAHQFKPARGTRQSRCLNK